MTLDGLTAQINTPPSFSSISVSATLEVDDLLGPPSLPWCSPVETAPIASPRACSLDPAWQRNQHSLGDQTQLRD